ncbi:MAG: hypothetical protein MUF59_07715 [Candidatus Krumholzibacteria bacterium]|jgi:hypothetical protein|nr:hypothetical protein [Candidatus Krumholzibacteria bacterium]
MVLPVRKPNRRHLKTASEERKKRQKEYFYSEATLLVVKLILLWFLCILLYISTKLFYFGLHDNPRLFRIGIPVVVFISIVILVYRIIKNIKEMKEQYNKQD